MVVAVFVLCIALGSFAVSALPRIGQALLPASLWGLLVLLAVLYRLADSAPYAAYVLRSQFPPLDGSFYPYYLSAFGALLLVTGLPVALSGCVLPLLFHALRDRVGDLGNVAGRLYSWNTLGSLLGALLGGYALLFWLDLHQVFRVALAAVALAAALATAGSRALAAGLALASLLAIAWLPAWRPERLGIGLYVERPALPHFDEGAQRFLATHPLLGPGGPRGPARWIFHDDGPEASVDVTEERTADGRLKRGLRTNGRPEGGALESDTAMRLAALLAALFAERTERVFVIGYGLGMTVGELAALDGTREVEVAEIVRGVIEAAPLFDDVSLGASRSPKVKITHADAFRALMRSKTRFDAIVSTPSNTWVAGVEMLATREFLETVRNHLAPGGVYVQWFHTNGFSDPSTGLDPLALALGTFARVFPEVAVWYGGGHELLLVGMLDARPALDLARLKDRLRRPDFGQGLARAGIRSLPSLLAHELLPFGVVQATALPETQHTLEHPRLGYLSARAFFTGGEAPLPASANLEAARVGAHHSLQRRLSQALGGRLPEEERGKLVVQLCLHRPRECAAQLAAWTVDAPASRARDAVIGALERTSGGRFDASAAAALLPLYDASRAPAGPLSPADAERASALFVSHYTHGAPFSRRALAELWQRCEAEAAQREACRAGRARVESRLGSLDVPLAAGPPA
jgi:spermidine synthase